MSKTLESVDIGSLITRTSGIKGNSPRIRGTGVTVQRIVGWYKLGLSPEEITRKVNHLEIRDTYAALAYYHANPGEIENLLANEALEYERLAADSGSKPSSPE
jgi:uncharacterized protein (DUF433 family)